MGKRGNVFPCGVALKGAFTDITKAQASREEDKRGILHYIAGTPDGPERQIDPPTSHKNYDMLNRQARERFITGAMHISAQQGDVESIRAIAADFDGAVDRADTLQRTAIHFAAELN